MKVLLVTLFLPHHMATHAGGRYVFEVLQHIAQLHEVHLVTRLENDEVPLLDSLKPFCSSIRPYIYRSKAKRGFFDNIQLVANYIGFSRYANNIIQSEDYDLVQVEWVEAGLFIRKSSTPMLLTAHDVMTKPAERKAQNAANPISRLFARTLHLLTRSIECRIMKRFDLVVTLSEFDKQYLRRMLPDVPVASIPIPAGLDITTKQYARNNNTIVFLASFKHRKVNVDAALYFYSQVFPIIRRELPDARFVIAGYGPPEELTSLAKADPQVSVTGFIEDIDRCYKEAAVFVAPILIGGGIIVKILDALAAGTPVVTTSIGNEGIRAVPGHDLLIANSPEEFAAATIKLLRDPEGAATMAKHGQAFVLREFGLETSMKKLEIAHQDLISHGGERSYS